MRTKRNSLSGPWAGLAFAVVGLVGLVYPAGVAARAQSPDSSNPRELRVSVHQAGRWVEAGRLAFDRFYRTRTLSLSQGLATTPLRVRLQKRGGGAAHLDSALVAGRAPTAAAGAALHKLMASDMDVADVSRGPVELLFHVLPGERRVLTLRGRIEPAVIGRTAFRFPRVNTGRIVNGDSSFYSYRLGSRRGRLRPDGELRGESLGAPFFQDAPYVDSGHPQGTTYGWVRDDGRTLYVAIDFTPDNTMDGELDYARVFALVDGRVKAFTVRQSSARWGRVGFTYTDRVGYQHKVYEFAIPLRALGVQARSGRVVELAFAAYGTAAAGAWDTQPMAYEPTSETYIFRSWQFGSTNLQVQLFDVLGVSLGAPIQVSTNFVDVPLGGVTADPDLGRFLVTWDEGQLVQGHFIDPVTGLDGAQFGISDNSDGQTENSRPLYDPDLQRYLVIWMDSRSGGYGLYGRFVGADGTPGAASFYIDDVELQNSSGTTNTPNFVYNTADQEFLVVFVKNNTVEGQRLDPADGSALGARITIAANGSRPSVAYEPTSNTYLVAWHTETPGLPTFMRSRLVWPDGSTEVVKEPMPSTPGILSTAVVGEVQSGRFLVVGHNLAGQLLGRFVNGSDGELMDASEFSIQSTDISCAWSGIATNPDLGHFGPGCFDDPTELGWMTVFPTLQADPTTVTTDEGGATDTFSVSLLTAPTADVNLTVVSDNTDEATVSPATLQFGAMNWDTPQTVTVTGVDDAVIDGDIAYTIDLTVDNATSAAEYRDVVLNVTGTNLDDDVAPVLCGDGVREGTETCDDGNTVDGDGCSATCQIEPSPCGDGIIDTGEECDDGNDIPGDGCHGCTVDEGWTCLNEPSYCEEDENTGCGCRSGSGSGLPTAALILLLGAFLLIRRRTS